MWVNNHKVIIKLTFSCGCIDRYIKFPINILKKTLNGYSSYNLEFVCVSSVFEHFEDYKPLNHQ